MNIYGVLAATGIPTYAGAWQKSGDEQTPPNQYIVFTYVRTPDQSGDDEVMEYATYAYVTLWSTVHPGAAIALIRAAAAAADWATIDERGLDYDEGRETYGTSWTFAEWEAA